MQVTIDTSDLQVLAKRLSDKPELQKAIAPYFETQSQELFALAFSDAPNRTGHLSRSLELSFPTPLTSVIGTNGSCKYFDFVYLGTRPHKIEAKNKKSLAFGSPDAILRKSVMHPGTKPNPFLYRTWLYNAKDFVDAMESAYVKVLDKETKV
jgi:hypothetical protein